MRVYTAIRPLLLTLLVAGPIGAQQSVSPDQNGSAVIPGAEVLLRDSLHLVRGRRVGLITNHTGKTRDGRSTIDLLHEHPQVRLVALFAPEHGIRGTAEGGIRIASSRDERTGLPIHSLYGSTQRPTAGMLRGIDALLFDMQDVGARPYTYVWTMAMAMEEAARADVAFVVLDRPNPITGRVEGPLMDMAVRQASQPITGYYSVPLRHGMTAGEIARYINREYRLGVRLTVIPAEGWSRDVWFDGTTLPWTSPSPNIRTLEGALNYSGLVLFEATNLSVGRGTAAPFRYVGAPWLDARALLERLRGYDLRGVRLSSTRLKPEGAGWVPYRGQTVNMVEIEVTDREQHQPVLLALVLLSEIRRLHPDSFRSQRALLQLLGSDWAHEALLRGSDPVEIYRRWEAENEAWVRSTAVDRLYR